MMWEELHQERMQWYDSMPWVFPTDFSLEIIIENND